jgi:hypothetical protein
MLEEFKVFENLIDHSLRDQNATITGCELGEHFGSTTVKVFYTLSDECAQREGFIHKDRIMEIVLKRGSVNEGLPIMSYANPGGAQQ